jgi:hypothetical protein
MHSFFVSFAFPRFESSENQKKMAQPTLTVTEAGDPKNETEQVLL